MSAPCTLRARTAPADGPAAVNAGGSGRGRCSDNTRARAPLPNPPLCRSATCLEKKLKDKKSSHSGQTLQGPGSDSARAFHVGAQQAADVQELRFPAEFPPCWSPSSNGILSSCTALTRRIQKPITVNSFTTSLLPPVAPKWIFTVPEPWLCSSRAAQASRPPPELITPFIPTRTDPRGRRLSARTGKPPRSSGAAGAWETPVPFQEHLP